MQQTTSFTSIRAQARPIGCNPSISALANQPLRPQAVAPGGRHCAAVTHRYVGAAVHLHRKGLLTPDSLLRIAQVGRVGSVVSCTKQLEHTSIGYSLVLEYAVGRR